MWIFLGTKSDNFHTNIAPLKPAYNQKSCSIIASLVAPVCHGALSLLLNVYYCPR